MRRLSRQRMPFIQDIGDDEDASPDASTILNITIARQARGEDGGGGGAAREAGAVEESAGGGGSVLGMTSDVISISASVASVIVLIIGAIVAWWKWRQRDKPGAEGAWRRAILLAFRLANFAQPRR